MEILKLKETYRRVRN